MTTHAVLAGGTAPSAPSWINVAAIIGFFVFGVSVLAMWIGTSLMARSNKGDMKGAAKTSGVAAMGVFWVALGVAGVVLTLGTGTVTYFLNK